MQYITKFTRNKPIAECVALNLPDISLPSDLWSAEAAVKSRRSWRKRWLKQGQFAHRYIDPEKKSATQAYYVEQLDELIKALWEVFQFVENLHVTRPDNDRIDEFIVHLCLVGRYQDATKLLTDLLEDQRLVQGDDAPAVGQSHLRLACLSLALDSMQPAARHAERAFEIWASNLGEKSPEAGRCLLLLAEMALWTGELEVAQKHIDSVRSPDLDGEEELSLNHVRALHLQAVLRGITRNFQDALATTREASALLQDLDAGADPTLPAKYRVFEGILNRKLRRWEEAHQCLADARGQLQDLIPVHHIDMARTMVAQGRLSMLRQDVDQADALLEQALGIFDKLPNARLEQLMTSTLRARLCRMQDRLPDANQAIRKGARAHKKLSVPNAEWQFRLQLEEAHLKLLDGKFEEAIPILRSLLERTDGFTAKSQTGELRLLLGKAYVGLGTPEEARTELMQAIQQFEDAAPTAEELELTCKAQVELALLWLDAQETVKAKEAVTAAHTTMNDLHNFHSPELEGKCEWVWGRIATMELNWPRAERHFRDALSHFSAVGKKKRDWASVVACRYELGLSLVRQGQLAQAVEELKLLTSSKNQRKLLSEDQRIFIQYTMGQGLLAEGELEQAHKLVLKAYKLLMEHPHPSSIRDHQMYEVRNQMGFLHLTLGKGQAAIGVFQLMLTDLQEFFATERELEAGVHMQLGMALQERASLKEASRHFQKCLDIRLALEGNSTRGVFLTRERLADVLEAQGADDAAVRELELLIQHSPEPAHASSNQRFAFRVARMQHDRGHMKPARERLEQLIAWKEAGHPTAVDSSHCLLILAQIHRHGNQLQQARALLQEAESAVPAQPDYEVLAQIQQNLADLDMQSGNRREAIRHLTSAQASFGKADNQMECWNCLRNLAKMSWQGQHREEAVKYLSEALELAKANPKLIKKPKLINLYLELGSRYAEMEQVSKALRSYKEGVQTANVKKSTKHIPAAARCLSQTAELLAVHKPQQVEKKYRQIINMYQPEVQPDTLLAESHLELGLLLWHRNQLQDALRHMSAAHQIFQDIDRSTSQAAMKTKQYRALLHSDLGHTAEARDIVDNELRPLLQVPPKLRPRMSVDNVNDHLHLLDLQGHLAIPES